jgi:hypothetical protein
MRRDAPCLTLQPFTYTKLMINEAEIQPLSTFGAKREALNRRKVVFLSLSAQENVDHGRERNEFS